MRLQGILTLAAPEIFLVVGVIALEPDHLAISLEGEDMRSDPIQEPTVMGDNDRAAGKIEQRLLQRPERFHVRTPANNRRWVLSVGLP